jgi:hypothetical protein
MSDQGDPIANPVENVAEDQPPYPNNEVIIENEGIENDDIASDDQNDEISDVPLHMSTPRDREAEKREKTKYETLFKQLVLMTGDIEQFLDAYKRDVHALETNEVTVLKANMIGRKLTGRDKEWTSNVASKLEILEKEREVIQFRPHHDELGNILFEIKERYLEEKMNGRALIQIKFPSVYKQLFPEKMSSTSLSETQKIVIEQKRQSAIYLDAKKFISEAFKGEEDSLTCLQDYASWKAAWDIFYQELKATSDGSEILAFSKMKTVLKGEALRLVSNFDARDQTSYEKAIKILEDKYSDKIALAISFIKDATKPSNDPVKKIRDMDHALAGLLALKESFEKETVNFYDFIIILMMSANMSEDMLDNWTSYKENLKQQHLANQRNKSEGREEKPWTAGMAENVTTFRAWMSVFVAPLSKKEQNQKQNTPETSTASNFFVRKEECFVCKGNHPYWKCSDVLKMNTSTWRYVCFKNNRCGLCSNPYTDNSHLKSCSANCRICTGKHNSVMCSKNKFRTGQLFRKRLGEDMNKEEHKRHRQDDDRIKDQKDTEKIENAVRKVMNDYREKKDGRGRKAGRGRGKPIEKKD